MAFIWNLGVFVVVTAAANELARYLKRVGLPLISGFLIVGILAGPYVFDFFSPEVRVLLRYVDMVSLAFIALAAGGELHLSEVRGQLRSLVVIISAQTVVTIGIGVVALILLAPYISFTQEMPIQAVVAVGILAGVIMVARSPSSAYALIKELRASGPFTQRILGVTVLKDAVVIILFAVGVSIAALIFEGVGFDIFQLLVLVLELLLDIALGLLLAGLLHRLFALRLPSLWKTVGLLLLGFLVFVVSDQLREVHLGPVRFFTEPLLICMTAGMVMANFSPYRTEFHTVVEGVAPLIFVVFFTSVGVSLRLDILTQSWAIILALVAVRAIGVYLGSMIGGVLSGVSMRENWVMGFTFLTQAGVSIGLSEEVAAEFHPWGEAFATLMVGSIVINQLIGPPLFKWALQWVGEAHVDGESVEEERSVLIFGSNNEMFALARELQRTGWQIQVVNLDGPGNAAVPEGVPVQHIPEIGPESFQSLGADHFHDIVLMCEDDELNYRLCRLAYEHAPQARCIVRLNDPANLARFQELEAIVLSPATAYIQLLGVVVRAPSAVAPILLGQDIQRNITEVIVRTRRLDGAPLRDISLPPGVLVLSIRRRNQVLVPHGHTRLRVGDRVSLFGEAEDLEKAATLFRVGSYASVV